jgi:hypothetical protein
MNRDLTPEELDSCLRSLEGALVQARLACWEKDLARAEALMDAFHNLPRLLRGDQPTWSLRAHNEMFLGPLLERYPALRGSVDHTLFVATDRSGAG